jgi:hypothetical protein
MKKLALVSAVAAATMTSLSAHSLVASTAGIMTSFGTDFTAPCPSTWSGGADGIAYDIAGPNGTTVSGTVCIDLAFIPTGYVMFGISMADATGGLNMDQGAIQISTNWGTTSGWSPYGVINVTPTNPIVLSPRHRSRSRQGNVLLANAVRHDTLCELDFCRPSGRALLSHYFHLRCKITPYNFVSTLR